MAHSSLNFGDGARGDAPAGRQQLAIEKLGVIAGFLAGLFVGVGVLAEPMASAGLPSWASVSLTVATVALFTWAGHRAGTSATELLRDASRG